MTRPRVTVIKQEDGEQRIELGACVPRCPEGPTQALNELEHRSGIWDLTTLYVKLNL